MVRFRRKLSITPFLATGTGFPQPPPYQSLFQWLSYHPSPPVPRSEGTWSGGTLEKKGIGVGILQ